MPCRPIALSLALLGMTAFVPSAQAQRIASGPAGHGGMGASRGGGFGGRPSYVPRGRRYFAGPGYWPYYDSGFDSGYEYGPAMQAPPPQVVYMPVGPPPAPEPPAKPAEAEVIELQGDHWVRLSPNGPPQVVGGSTQQQRAAISPPPAAVAPAHPTQAATPIAATPSAMLVFRDGHQEAIGRYTIMGTTIYVSTEYWTSGAWTRSVQIAELDVPATLKLNRERGANFRLPSGPEEVMIGP
jgi:hypothetical protein